MQELNELLKEQDMQLEELESRVEGLHTWLQDPAKGGGGVEELTTCVHERDACVEELEARLEQRDVRWDSSAEEHDKCVQELSACVKERELRLKERDTCILEQDIQIQDLTNRLSEQALHCSATDEQENHVLDAQRVEDLKRRLHIQEQLRIQEERMRIEEGRLYWLRWMSWRGW